LIYRVILKPSARKELDDIPDHDYRRIDEAIIALKLNPFPFPQSKQLKGESTRRLRVGMYRVVYEVDQVEMTVTVYRVRHRRESYR
jgi:mRNA interferase RelE/StbE